MQVGPEFFAHSRRPRSSGSLESDERRGPIIAVRMITTLIVSAPILLMSPILIRAEENTPNPRLCQSLLGSPPTFTADNAYYCMTWNQGLVMHGPFGAGNNSFGAHGQTHSQTMTVNTSTFPNGTSWSWTWPAPATCCSVDSFYATFWGTAGFARSADPGAPAPIQLKNIRTLTATLDASVTDSAICIPSRFGKWTGNIDAIFDIFLFGNPDPSANYDPLFEIEIVAHNGPALTASPAYTVSENGRTWTGYDYDGRWWFTTGSDVLAGTIDLHAILQSLVTQGYATGKEWFLGIPFGAEVWCGTGSLTINSISYRLEN